MNMDHERQYNLDLMKALAIICMVFCHPVFRLAPYRAAYESEVPFIFGNVILGEYLIVAHGLMFAMGVGIMFTRRSEPSYLIRRGIRLYLLAYVLNFFRYGMYALGYSLVTGELLGETRFALFAQDILQFAGLALIFTGIFKKLHLRATHMLLIGLVLSTVNSLLPQIDTGNYALNLILGSMIYVKATSAFSFFTWYLFVAAGLVFGEILQKAANKDIFYRRLLPLSGGIACLYLAATCRFGMFFLSRQQDYYAASPAEALGLLSIDLFFLSVFYFILKKTGISVFRYLIEMSRNITVIYFIHWILLGLIEVVFCYLNEIVFSYPAIYAIGACLLVVSTLLARTFTRLKSRFALADGK